MKKKLISLILTAFLAFAVFGALGVSAAPTQKEPISPGIIVLAEKNGMSKSGIRGKELSLKREDFARALNRSSVGSVTFTSVPSSQDGELRLGNTVLKAGQTVSGSNLSLISFVADSDKVSKTSFCFSPDGAAYELECTLHLLDEVNYAPSVSLASAVSLDVSTYENVNCYGRLSAYDPDGDACCFEIVSYPESGALVMSDKSTGEYVYVPTSGFVGKDSFSYVAKDMYGNYSASAEVSVSVSRASLSAGFEDMKNDRAHAAAIKLTEAGIMSGTQIGNEYYFEPERSVSRAEFVTLAMRALGIKQVNGLRVTDFADDGAIPSAYKGYVSAAYELEYVMGSYVDGELCFLPNDNITRAEAAVIVGRMLSVATPVLELQLSDAEDVPAWAESSVYSLCSMGVMDTEDGAVRAREVMSRADTAIMLSAMMKAK